MSRRETPMLRSLWRWEVGGTLVEEFPVVEAGDGVRPRWIDGVILRNAPTRIAAWGEALPLTESDVVVVQVKASPLTMSLMGQTLFSADLIERDWRPRSLKVVALCTEDDARLRPLLERDVRCRVRVWRHGYREDVGTSHRARRRPRSARPPTVDDILAWAERSGLTPSEAATRGLLSDGEVALLRDAGPLLG